MSTEQDNAKKQDPRQSVIDFDNGKEYWFPQQLTLVALELETATENTH
jgi:hypothetical protein